jgi:hypothetical protein
MDNVTRAEPEPVGGAQRVRLIVVALLCVLYLLNLTGGWIEIPDCLPIVGNLDEVAATVVLMRCLGKMGFEVMPG